MKLKHTHPYQSAFGWTMLAVAIPLLWWVNHPERQIIIEPARFLFLHNAAEMFAVVVAMLVFITGYRSIFSVRQGAVVLLGVAFFGVGLFDFMHALSYAGMPDALTTNTSQKSIFFWLAARMLAAVSLLGYALLPNIPDITTLKKRIAFGIMVAVVGVFVFVGLFSADRIPALFVTQQGITPLKINLEWLVIVTNLITVSVLWWRRDELITECVMALCFAAALSAVSELFFTQLGVIDKDAANGIGHLYKIAAYLYLFHATFNEALRRPLERIKIQNLREKLILSASPDGVLWVNESGIILMANPAIKTLTGYSVDELIGQNVDIFLPAHLRALHAESMRGYFMAPHARAMGSMDLKLLCLDGRMLPVDISLGNFDDDGIQYAIAYIRDLSERKKFEESLRHQATHDELTDLPNRFLFRQQLDQSLIRSKHSGLRVAVLFMDLDYFKNVNDSFGHMTGDTLLMQISGRISSVLGENATLARLGGDEFAILLTDLTDAIEAANVAVEVINLLQDPFRVQDQNVYSGGSLGIAFYPDDAQDGDTLLRYADMAMYHAKQAGRGTFSCYVKEMDRRVRDDRELYTRLKEAMAQDRLTLHYQPQVDVWSGAIVGAEALLRWYDPVLGNVPPSRFIPVAEATGLILPLSDWVLQTACEQIAAWTQAGTPLCVAVNFSAQQFREQDLYEKLLATLIRTNAEAKWLCIEITESIAMTQPEEAYAELTAIAKLGCSIALDDFGTGYSSLAYLKTLPVSKLKIDKSFMDGIPQVPNDVTISSTIIALAYNLGMTLIAEGGETDEQLAFLRQYNCETYQGWLFAKAMSAKDLTELLVLLGP